MEACLAAVDSNGNGLVEEDEYVAWVLDKPYEDPMVTHSILAGIAAIAVVVESDEPVAKNHCAFCGATGGPVHCFNSCRMKAKAPSTEAVHLPTPGGGGAVSSEAGFASKSSVSAMDGAGWPKTGSSYTMLNRGSGKIVEVEEVRVDASTGAMGAHKFQPGVDKFFVSNKSAKGGKATMLTDAASTATVAGGA
jgi:hypothetical protein